MATPDSSQKLALVVLSGTEWYALDQIGIVHAQGKRPPLRSIALAPSLGTVYACNSTTHFYFIVPKLKIGKINFVLLLKGAKIYLSSRITS